MTGDDQARIRELFAGYALALDAGDLQLRPALYDDELTRVTGQWRFTRRRCRFITSTGLAVSPEVSPA